MATQTIIAAVFFNMVIVVYARLSAFVEFSTPGAAAHSEMLQCYERYASVPLHRGVILFHSAEDDVHAYIRPITSPKAIYSHQGTFADIWPYSLVVLVTAEIEFLEQIFKYLSAWTGWILRTRYLVVYDGDEEMDEIFRLAWRKHIVNIVILRPNDTDVHTYFPYARGACGERIRAQVLGACTHLAWDDLFPAKVPKVFNGCTLRMVTRYNIPAVLDPFADTGNARVEGLEVSMMNVLVKWLNLTKSFKISQTGKPWRSSPSTDIFVSGVLAVYKNISEMCFGIVERTPNMERVWDSTYTFYHNDIVWQVPFAADSAQWQTIIIEFSSTLWYSVLGVFALNVLTWWIFGKVAGANRSYIDCILESLLVLLGGSVTFPKRSVMRYLIISWTWCSLLLMTAYQSQFLSILMTPMKEKQITDEYGIINSNLFIIHKYGEREIILTCHPDFEEKIERDGIYLPKSNYSQISQEKFRHSACLMYRMHYIYMYKTFREHLFYLFKKPVRHTLHSNYFQKGHPVFDRWNEVLMQAVDSGVLHKLQNEVEISYDNPPLVVEEGPITLHHLNCAFLILFFGLSLATLTFLIELMCYIIQKYVNN